MGFLTSTPLLLVGDSTIIIISKFTEVVVNYDVMQFGTLLMNIYHTPPTDSPISLSWGSREGMLSHELIFVQIPLCASLYPPEKESHSQLL